MPVGSSFVVVDTSVVSLLIRRDRQAACHQIRMVGRRTVVSFQT